MFYKFLIWVFLIYGSVFCIDQNRFQLEALISHNLYRHIHGVPNLSLNQNLSNIAYIRAHELAKSKYLSVKQLEFKGKKLGETIGCVSGFNEYNGIIYSEFSILIKNYFNINYYRYINDSTLV